MEDFSRLKIVISHWLTKYLLISFLCFLDVFSSYAQLHYAKFDHLTINDGLSSNRISAFCRDRKGNMWIGTSDAGLNKFDSYQITLYQKDVNQPGSISDNSVTFIFEDRKNNLWVGTQDGLNLYNTDFDSFTVFKNDSADIKSLSNNFITSIIEDKTGNIWIATENGGGLNKWTPGKEGFIHYKISDIESDSRVNSFTSLCQDDAGNLWIGNRSHGLYCFHPESGTFILYDDPAVDFGNNVPKNIFVDDQGLIWIASRAGLISFDPFTSKFEHFGTKADGKGTSNSLVRQVIQEDHNHLVIALNQGGLNILDKASRTFEYIGYDDKNGDGLNSPSIYVIYKDYENILWVGTPDGGVNYYIPQKDGFKLFAHRANNPNSIPYNIVVCFYEDSEGFIWIGTAGGGVSLFNPKTESFSNYNFDPSNPYSISGNAIRCITEDKEKNLWFGTFNSGLNRFDRQTGRFYHYLPNNKNLLNISSNRIWHMITDHNDNIWLGGTDTGIDVFNEKDGVIKRFRADQGIPNSLSSNRVWLISEDLEKNIWVCTSTGLNLYDSINNTFKVYANFPDNDIRAFCKDKSGNLWAGTFQSGLILFKPDGSIVKIYNTTNGLPNNTIHAIVEDNYHNLWISTNRGISQFNYITQKFRNFTFKDGLQSNQFYPQSFLKTRNGEIYFGGYNGFNSFYPDSLKFNDLISPVYITDFQLFNKKVPIAVPGSPLKNNISETKEITLSWDQSVFSFQFLAINFSHPERTQYAYMMDGFEKDWNYTDASRRYVTYTNLDPGEYTFKVKASKNDGVWRESDSETSVRIIVRPPWWGTWLFRIMAILAIVLLVGSFYLSRVRNLRNQKIILEKLVAIKTSELIESNAAKDRFFSIIAHDLRSPLGAFIGLTQVLAEGIQSKTKEEMKAIIVIMKESATNVYGLLENLLDWSRLKMGKLDIVPETFNVKQKITASITILTELARKKGIVIHCSLPDDLEIYGDTHMFETVIRNLVSNAIKFTRKSGEISVSAEAMMDHSVCVKIRDTGIGMDKELIDQLFLLNATNNRKGTAGEPSSGLGLLLCKEFIEKHGGRIWVESEPDKGSTFQFILPLNTKRSV